MTVRFIDDNRKELGVEPICRTLQVAPSTYYAAKARPPSARSLRDALMVPVLLVIFQANYSVYGAHKLWKAARRAGYDLGRDQVARLMKLAGIAGARRGRRVFTTRPARDAARPPDLVKRQFTASRPNALRVTDLTRHSTDDLAAVADALNTRPRKTLNWRTPAEGFNDLLLSNQQAGVATTH
jgi:putative transposase